MRSSAGRCSAPLAALGGAAALLCACTVVVPLEGVSAGDGGISDAEEPAPDLAGKDAPGGPAMADSGAGPRDAGGSEAGPAACEPHFRRIDYRIERPQVLLTVSRSMSMLMKMFGPKRLRDAVRDELFAVIVDQEGGIEFGLSEFPAQGMCTQTSGCCASGVLQRPSAINAKDIERQLMCPKTGTSCFEAPPDAPIGDALAQIRAFYNPMVDPSTDVFVVVITDSAASCMADPTACDSAKAEAARLYNSLSIKTIVLGVGEAAKAGNTCLDDLARAGGVAKQGSPAYAAAADPGHLKAAIQEALAPVTALTCRLRTPSVINTTDSIVGVWADGMRLQRDPTGKEGWNFDPPGSDTIRFYGAACDALRAGFTSRGEIEVQQRCMRCNGKVMCPP
jgi:hypothetical protein